MTAALPVNRAAYTIDEFCIAHRISRRTFYDLIDRGDGPKLMRIGSKKLVSAEAAAKWRRDCRAASNRMPAAR
jgi:predicted DNA-binding transcriptional regulator AlpA